MAATFMERGINIVSNGTENHMFLVDLVEKGLTGKDADAALGRANITVNKKGKKFSLISGGRYDGLLKNLGSKKNTTAVGAAIDMSLL